MRGARVAVSPILPRRRRIAVAARPRSARSARWPSARPWRRKVWIAGRRFQSPAELHLLSWSDHADDFRSLFAPTSSRGGRAAAEGVTRRTGPGATLRSLSIRLRSVAQDASLFNSLIPPRVRVG